MRHEFKIPIHAPFVRAARIRVPPRTEKPLFVGIHIPALEHNVGVIRQRISGRSLCAVLKGDAYGHGISLVAPALLSYCSHVAVVDNDEAQAVRNLCQTMDIIRLRVGSPQEIEAALRDGVRIREMVGSTEKAEEIGRISEFYGKETEIHIALDVAEFGRDGFSVQEEFDLRRKFAEILKIKNIKVASLGCHLPDAGKSSPLDSGDPSRRAVERFTDLAKSLCHLLSEAGRPMPEISAFSSASSVAFGDMAIIEKLGLRCFDRIGNSLFGLTSAAKHAERKTRQVMHVGTVVCDCIHRPKGAKIGYERTYTVNSDSGESIALLGVGWLSCGRNYQGIGKTETPAFVVNSAGGRHLLIGRQSMNIATLSAVDEHGRCLRSGDIVYLTTDSGHPDNMPSVPVLSRLLGGVQPESITSSFGGTSSSIRFSFS